MAEVLIFLRGYFFLSFEYTQLKMNSNGFPSGPGVKNPPGNAGVTGSIPGPVRFHIPRATTTEPT